MRDSGDAGLVKIQVELPANSPVRTESMWAEPLGGDLYRVRNSPFLAYDLNFHDVVRAFAELPDQLPMIREVVERSGHKTLRAVFKDDQPESAVEEILRGLNKRAANYEKARGRFYAIDVRPEADYPSICTYLWGLQQNGVLSYETGPTREDGPDGWRSWGQRPA